MFIDKSEWRAQLSVSNSVADKTLESETAKTTWHIAKQKKREREKIKKCFSRFTKREREKNEDQKSEKK